jgi:hypothetical protein
MDFSKDLILEWTDFIKIPDLTNQERNIAGVYVWGFTIENDFVPYYVGIANDILFRINEHINSIIGGKYTIYHKNSLADFRLYKDDKIQEDKNKGKMYIPDWPNRYNVFLENRKELQPHIDFMVDSFTFSYAATDRNLITGPDLREIEKICIHHFGRETLFNTRTGHSDKFSINHSGNPTITEKIKARNG